MAVKIKTEVADTVNGETKKELVFCLVSMT